MTKKWNEKFNENNFKMKYRHIKKILLKHDIITLNYI